MSVLKLQGDASGTGVFTVAAPGTSTDRTLTLPDEAGTIVSKDSDNNISGVASVNGSQLGGNRNIVINGAMTVAQRSASETGVTNGGYNSVDRFEFILNALGTWTSEQSTDAPDGFAHSHKLTATTGNASPAGSAYAVVFYAVEAQDLQALQYGLSGAKTAVVSFWVKSNKTGNASFTIQQPDSSSRTLPQQYTINSADTWEYKTITIVGDTSGNIDNNNDAGLKLEWWLDSGTDYTGGSHSSTWIASDNTARNASNLGVGGATSDYFAITGVQFELSDSGTATDFEHESYGTTLQKCQRYYIKSINSGSTSYPSSTGYARGMYLFPVQMRASPTGSYTDLGSGGTQGGTTVNQDGFWITYGSLGASAAGTFDWTMDAEL